MGYSTSVAKRGGVAYPAYVSVMRLRDPVSRGWPIQITMFSVYILQSLLNSRYYIGQTTDVEDRLRRHNGGHTRSTAPHKPWKIAHVEEYTNRTAAILREREIKSFRGGILFKKLLGLVQ